VQEKVKKPRLKEFKGRDIASIVRVIDIIAIDEKLNLSREYQRPGRMASFMIACYCPRADHAVRSLSKNMHDLLKNSYSTISARKLFNSMYSEIPYMCCVADKYDCDCHCLTYIISDGDGWLPIGPKDRFQLADVTNPWDSQSTLSTASSYINAVKYKHDLSLSKNDQTKECILNSIVDWHIARASKTQWTCGKQDKKLIRNAIRDFMGTEL
jgi:hypothetical protein